MDFFSKICFPQAHRQRPVDLGGWGKAWAGVSSLWFWILTSAISLQRNSFVHVFCWAFSWKWTCFELLKRELGDVESIHNIVTSVSLWSISTMKVQIQIMQTFFHLKKLPYPCSAFRVVFQKMVLAWSRWASENFYGGGRKCKKLGLSSLEGGIRFWLSNHDERSMQSLKRFVHPSLTSEQEMIIR